MSSLCSWSVCFVFFPVSFLQVARPSPLATYDNISSFLMLFRPLIQLPDSPEGPLNSCSTVLRAVVLKNSCSGPTKPLAANRKLFLAILLPCFSWFWFGFLFTYKDICFLLCSCGSPSSDVHCILLFKIPPWIKAHPPLGKPVFFACVLFKVKTLSSFKHRLGSCQMYSRLTLRWMLWSNKKTETKWAENLVPFTTMAKHSWPELLSITPGSEDF